MADLKKWLKNKNFSSHTDEKGYESYKYYYETLYKHIDEYDEDIYDIKLMSIIKYPIDGGSFWYEVYYSSTNPGLGREDITFKKRYEDGYEPTILEIKNIIKFFNIF